MPDKILLIAWLSQLFLTVQALETAWVEHIGTDLRTRVSADDGTVCADFVTQVEQAIAFTEYDATNKLYYI